MELGDRMRVVIGKGLVAFGSVPVLLGTGVLLAIAACDGDTGPAGPAGSGGQPTPTQVAPGAAAPAVIAAVTALSGASGPGGTFQVGARCDMVRVAKPSQTED